MEFEKLNFYTITIFIVILLLIGYLIFLNYKNFKLLSKKNYFLRKKSNLKYVFLILSFILVLFTIFSPKAGILKSNQEARGIDIVFALDVSKSMNVADLSDKYHNYTRLDIAKLAISNFVSKYKENRYGLVIFAGDAIGSVPLTLDHNVFLTFLKGVDYRNILKQGTDLKKAIKLAVNRFDFNNDRAKAVIIISDGADSDYNIDINYFKDLKEKYKQLHFYVVGIGTKKGGKIIKGFDLFGRPIYQKYKGDYVISKLNRNNLQLLASLLNAKYIEVLNVDDLEKLSKYFDKMEKKILYSNINGEKNSMIRLFIILSFISFVIYLFLDIGNIYFNKNKVVGN